MQAGSNLMHFWNDDYDDDLTHSNYFSTCALNISVHISGAQEFRFRPNGVILLNGDVHGI